MTETISISEFKATCLKVINQVKTTGMSIIVTKRGEPYALVTKPPASEKIKSWIGQYKSEIVITGDIIKPAVDENDWEILK